jgi:hypothetical protein
MEAMDLKGDGHSAVYPFGMHRYNALATDLSECTGKPSSETRARVSDPQQGELNVSPMGACNAGQS